MAILLHHGLLCYHLVHCDKEMTNFGALYLVHIVVTHTTADGYIHMWLDLKKADFHAHNSKTHFSPSTVAVHINYQFSHGQILVLKAAQAAFAVACFWGLSDVHECLGDLEMAPSPLDKQTASYNLPHDWLMNLSMDLAALCDKWKWKWH